MASITVHPSTPTVTITLTRAGHVLTFGDGSTVTLDGIQFGDLADAVRAYTQPAKA